MGGGGIQSTTVIATDCVGIGGYVGVGVRETDRQTQSFYDIYGRHYLTNMTSYFSVHQTQYLFISNALKRHFLVPHVTTVFYGLHDCESYTMSLNVEKGMQQVHVMTMIHGFV